MSIYLDYQEDIDFDELMSMIYDFEELLEDRLPNKVRVQRYNKRVSKNSELTYHYKNFRILRENQITKLIGEGLFVATFVVDDGSGQLQINEVRDNGTVHIYDYENHQKITMFAPSAKRMVNLFKATGELPTFSLIEKCNRNEELGYSNILNK